MTQHAKRKIGEHHIGGRSNYSVFMLVVIDEKIL